MFARIHAKVVFLHINEVHNVQAVPHLMLHVMFCCYGGKRLSPAGHCELQAAAVEL